MSECDRILLNENAHQASEMKWSNTDPTHWILAPDDELAIHGTISVIGKNHQFYAYLGGGDYTSGFRSTLKAAKLAVESALGVMHEGS